MAKKRGKSTNLTGLREQAEELLRATRHDVAAMPINDVQQLVHELQVHQVELEMQNEELRRTQVELEAARDRYVKVYDEAPTGYLTLDPTGIILEANLPACTLLGINRKDLLGKTVVQYLATNNRAAFRHHIHELFLTGIRQVCDVDLARQADSPVSVQFESVAVQDEAGPATRMLTAVLDITQRRRIEKALQQTHNELEQLVAERTAELRQTVECLRTEITEHRQVDLALQVVQSQVRQMQKMDALGQLAGGVAHDFNNILTAILGNAEIASAKIASDHPSRTNLTRILEAGDRASRLVQQILTFTHQQAFSRTLLALAPVVDEALALLRATLPAGIQLTSTFDPATPPVLADATQIHQVVMNLCTNAWHALGEQPGSIALNLATVTLTQPLRGLHSTLPPGLYARLSVRDSGCGMDLDTLERIFDPFFTTKPVGQGTGLGLSVVHGIILGHEGAIVVESQPGHGTTVHLYFPAADAAAPVREPAKAAAATLQGRNPHLLYLDDENMLVELVRVQFERLGYRVSGYTKPTEALEAVRADPGGFDVVVTDYNMPGMSGLEVARALARLRADLPVVLVSGYLSPTAQAALRAAGITEIIDKPNMLRQLGDVIPRLLDRPPQA
ncbi:MAG: ATP-binding protein [Nitrospirae bacterium]|nr:ATP-binding protein [Nitrospirota bacterium]